MKPASMTVLVAAAASAVTAAYVRLDKNNATSAPAVSTLKAMIFIDVQEGLFSLARDFNHIQMKQAFLAQAELAKIFNLATVITTSGETGANGPLMRELPEILPNATIISRTGIVNAWDDASFRAAVEATAKTQFIISGITTDVCTAMAALAMTDAGYQVFANGEASGSSSEFVRDMALERMRQGGVQVVSTFAIMSELMRSWANTPGAAELVPFLDTYYPAYGSVARAYNASSSGTV